jgi:hypothetical protein
MIVFECLGRQPVRMADFAGSDVIIALGYRDSKGSAPALELERRAIDAMLENVGDRHLCYLLENLRALCQEARAAAADGNPDVTYKRVREVKVVALERAA